MRHRRKTKNFTAMNDISKLQPTVVSWIKTEDSTTIVFTYGKSIRVKLGKNFENLGKDERETLLDVISADAVLKLITHFILPTDADKRREMFDKLSDSISDEDVPELKKMLLPGVGDDQKIIDLLHTIQNKAKQ